MTIISTVEGTSLDHTGWSLDLFTWSEEWTRDLMRDKLYTGQERPLVLLVADLFESQLLDASDSLDLLLVRPFKVNLVHIIIEILKHRQFANTFLDKVNASLGP